MAFQARKVPGAFEKQATGPLAPESSALTMRPPRLPRVCIEPAVTILIFVKSPGGTAVYIIMKMRSHFDVHHLQNRAMIHAQI